MRIFVKIQRQPLIAAGTIIGVAFALLQPAQAATLVEQDFETAITQDYSKITGKGADGSTLEISTDKAHSGKQSLKISYQTSGGYFQFTPTKPSPLDLKSNQLAVSFWIYGAGKRDFATAALRLIDKNNESFQFDIPGFAEAMNGDGWREVQAVIDISKIGGHWGDKSDGILDAPFAFFGLAASRSAENAASGVVYIDDMRFGEPPLTGTSAPAGATAQTLPATTAPVSALPAGIKLAVKPIIAPATGPAAAMLNWVSPPGKPLSFQAQLSLPAPQNGCSLIWKVRDAFDKVLAQGKKVVPDGGLEKAVNFRLDNPPRGVLYVSAMLQNGKEEVLAESQTRAAVFTPNSKPVPLAPYVWGVAGHLGREKGKYAEDEITLMRMIGFASSRTDMTWSSIQPTPDTWDWSVHDKIYGSLVREGISPAPVLAYGTQWATTGDANSKDWHQWNNTPPRNEAFAKYAAEAVKRYGKIAPYWEIWNEPDIDFWLGSVEQYSVLVEATVAAVKAVDPKVQIMNGGFSETKRRPDFIPTYLKITKQQPDIFAIHTHGPFENMLRAETTVNATLANAGLTGAKKPGIWLNEAGYSNVRAPESEQAVQLVKKMAYSPAAGFMGYTWYDLRDDGTDPNENEHHFGLVLNDFAPKASMVAANTLLNTIGGKRFDRKLEVGKSGYALLYRGLGTSVLTAWRQSYTKGEAIVPLVMRAKSPNGAPVKLEKRDIFGNNSAVATRDGLFFLELGNVPQYIVAPSEDVQFELARGNGMLIDFPPAVVATPGEALSVPVKMTNPFSVPLKANLTMEGAAPTQIEVAPLSSKAYNVTVKSQGKPGSRETVKVSLQSPQIPAPLNGVVEVQTAYVVPAAPANLEVTLPRSGVVSIFEATPMLDLHIKDAADLGATVQLQKTAEGTRAHIVVTDQTHFPVPEGGNWWRGDSVQFAVGLPGGEMWEWMGALLPDGPKMIVSQSPDGKIGAAVPIDIKREGNQTIYDWTLPKTLPGGTPLPDRFNFDFIVNDNDGKDRKGWIEWTPGIGIEKNPSAFVPLAVQQ